MHAFETPSLTPEALAILPQFCKLLSLSKPWCPPVHRRHQVHGKDSENPVEPLLLQTIGCTALERMPAKCTLVRP